MAIGNPTRMRQKIISITQRLGLPSTCVLCSQYHSGLYAVCGDCTKLFQPINYACCYCAFPLSDDTLLVCGKCIKNKPAFDSTMTAYRFEEPLRTLLHQYKYQNALYLRKTLTQLMLHALPKEFKTECLIPVPLHPIRLRERGFNQAVELTKQLAKHLSIPYDPTLCKKILHTTTQTRLNRKKRQQNLRHAFKASSCTYQHVTLVDDLLTTGSTVNELAFVLKQQGVKQVDIWCCARAI